MRLVHINLKKYNILLDDMTKIMLADDSPPFLQTLKRFLVAEEFEVVGEATNGYDAVEKYKESNPDLLLMDVLMPKMSGLAALKEIIEHDPNAKVIMMSALDRTDLKEEALKVGVKHFLFKPFQMDELLVTIEKVLNQ